jgi:hypothetical protein
MGIFDKLFNKRNGGNNAVVLPTNTDHAAGIPQSDNGAADVRTSEKPLPGRPSAAEVFFSHAFGFLIFPQGIHALNGLRVSIEPAERLRAEAGALECGEKVFAAMKGQAYHFGI